VIAALFVLTNGIYFSDAFDPWDELRDARKYKGPYKVIAHPPCERWGRYWGGGPMIHGTPKQRLLGDDNGCFSHALWSVRTFGGVLEHPEASHAFTFYGLQKPSMKGGWTAPDKFGGRSCCVARLIKTGRCQRLSSRQRKETPIEFRDLLWSLL
jgi:hypothetical protein